MDAWSEVNQFSTLMHMAVYLVVVLAITFTFYRHEGLPTGKRGMLSLLLLVMGAAAVLATQLATHFVEGAVQMLVRFSYAIVIVVVIRLLKVVYWKT